jgi:NADPH oxidase 5
MRKNKTQWLDQDLIRKLSFYSQKKDSKLAGLSLGMSLHLEVHKKDVLTGLRTATRTGRPDWPSVFTKINRKKQGSVHVFYCGPHALEKQLRFLSVQQKFKFSWENF